MKGPRAARVADQIRESLARSLREDVRDPDIGFVTVTGVKLSSDLRHARVYVSMLVEGADRQRSLDALRRAAPFLKRSLARGGGLRFTPQLEFLFDASLETGSRVEDLLRRMHEGEATDAED